MLGRYNAELTIMVHDDEHYAYFKISGDFDPAEITARVGVQPSESWKRGDICPKRQVERTFSRWRLNSRLGRDQALEEHVRDVLAQLGVNPEGFRTLSSEFAGCMQLVGLFREGYPRLHFD